METQSPPQKGAGAPKIFGPCLLWRNGWMDQDAYCGQTAGWITMPLGMKVGLSPGGFVLDGKHTTKDYGYFV